MRVKHLQTPAELDALCPVLLELRPQYGSSESLKDQIYKQQQEDGYQLAYVEGEGDGEDAGQVLCVAGFVLGNKLAWGKFLYVDDLVTSSRHRSRGAGQLLMEWLRRHALSLGCDQLHLDSGVTRFRAHRFYLREGFSIKSHHFSIEELHADSP